MTKSADQLADDGEALQRTGTLVVVLSPAQEWMAIEQQVPFIRGAPIPWREHTAEGRGVQLTK